MKPLQEMTKEELKDIKLIVFDVDGVLVPRGTKIKQEGNTTTLETKVIERKEIGQIKELRMLNFMCHKNFSIEFHPTSMQIVTGANGSGIKQKV